MSEIWPLVPNWTSVLKETYVYKTEIFTSRDGTEQRRAFRTTPRRSVAYDSIVTDTGLRELEGLLARMQADLLYGADYVRGVRSTSAMPVGGNTLRLRLVPTWLSVGQKVSVSYRRIVRLFTVAAISGATVTFVEQSDVAFGAGARVSRTVAGYVDTSLSTTRITGTIATVATSFEPDPATESVDEGFLDLTTWFDGREIFTHRPNWSRSPSITYSHDVETVDYGRGRVQRFTPVTFGTEVKQATYLKKTQVEADGIRHFFARMKGRLGEFYLPTWSDDMHIIADVPSMTTQLRVSGTSTFSDYAADTGRRSIMITMRDGSHLALRLSSITQSGGNSVLNIESGHPFDIRLIDVRQISWMLLSRFASDSLTVEWVSDGVAQTTIAITSLEYQPAEPMDLGDLDELTLYMLSTFGWDFTENVLCDPLQWAVNVKYPVIAEV